MAEERIDITIAVKNAASAVLSDMKKDIIGIGAAWLTWDIAKDMFKAAWDEATKMEKQLFRLQGAVERAGYSYEAIAPEIDEFTRRMTNQKGVVDDYVQEALVRALDFTKDFGDAQLLTSAAIDLAAAKDIDLTSAVQMLGKAYNGSGEALKKLGVELGNYEGVANKAAYINTKIEAQFGEAAQAQMRATTTQWELLADALGDYGASFFFAMGAVSDNKEEMGWFAKWMETVRISLEGMTRVVKGEFVEGFKQMFALFTGSLDEYTKAEKDAATAAAARGEAQKGANKETELTVEEWKQMIKLGSDPAFTAIMSTPVDWFKKQKEAIKEARDQMAAWRKEWNAAQIGGADPEKNLKGESDKMADQASERSEAEIDRRQNEHRKKREQAVTQENSRALSAYSKTFRAIAGWASDTLDGAISSAARAGVDKMVELMWEGHLKFVDIFKEMAKAFIKYFVEAAVNAIAGPLIKGIGKVLKWIFHPTGTEMDEVARQQGRYMAHHFLEGAQEGIQRLPSAMIGGVTGYTQNRYGTWGYRPLRNAEETPWWMRVAEQNGINININGAMTTDFVNGTVSNVLRKGSDAGFSDVSVKQKYVTGYKNAAFA